MKCNRVPSVLCLLICALVFLNACNGQDQVAGKERVGNIDPPVDTLPKIQGTAGGDNVHCAIRDRSGNLWFGTTSQGVYRYDGTAFTHFTTEEGLNHNQVWCVYEDKDGNILFGTNRGVTLFDGTSLSDFSRSTEFGKESIWSMTEDKTGTLWITTGTRGVYTYDGLSFSRLLADESIANERKLTLNWINGITVDREGDLWFASWAPACEGVIRYDGQALKQFTKTEGLPDTLVHTVLEDRRGQLWVGTRNNGVFRLDGKAFVNVTENTALADAAIYTIIEDSRGHLWFCTERNGVWRYDGTSFKSFTEEDGLINNSVFSAVEDGAGNLWFGTRKIGLCRYDGKSFVSFTE